MAIWNRSFIPRLFFTNEEEAQITEAIRLAEQGTAGEILVRIERRCPGEPLEYACNLLHSLGITVTKRRTGILIYMSISDRNLAICGDEAIHNEFGTEGWQKICDQLSARFHNEEFTEGLCEAIQQIGDVLTKAFPMDSNDVNELPNEPSYEE